MFTVSVFPPGHTSSPPVEEMYAQVDKTKKKKPEAPQRPQKKGFRGLFNKKDKQKDQAQKGIYKCDVVFRYKIFISQFHSLYISNTNTLTTYVDTLVEMGEQHNHSKVVFLLPPDKIKITYIDTEKKTEQKTNIGIYFV